MPQRTNENSKPFMANLITPSFIVYLITMLVGVGISVGTYQINISTTRAENERLAQDQREIREKYLRIDI